MSGFPFSAIVGQDALREALLACAVDPAIGGVLVRGERGTAKSTAVRGLAPLLPAIDVVEGSRFRAAPGEATPDGVADGPVVRRPVALVELPVGATADRLLGSLDVQRALRDGEAAFEPGLLAAAHRGVLYVDEVNLLPDHLVDVLLDAAAMGRVHVEREGVSVSHAARFLLVGTMNPEEGELRPQLLDRFGLSVEVAGPTDPAERVEIVRRRLAFDADPAGFAAGFARAEQAVADRIAAARSRLGRLVVDERALLLIASTCARLGVDGMRADIVTARTAAALAALDAADAVGADHVRRAALLALAHRRRRGPLDPPGLSEAELDRAMGAGDDEGPDGPNGDGGPSSGGRASNGGDGTRRAANDGHRSGDAAGTRAQSAPDHADAGRDAPSAPGRPMPLQSPDPAPDAPAPRRSADRALALGTAGGAVEDGPADAPPVAAPSAPAAPPLLQLAGIGRGAAGRRSRARGGDGQSIDSAPPPGGEVTDLALAATLRAAARRGARTQPHRTHRGHDPGPHAIPPRPRAILPQDLREHVRAGREANLVVFCVDASGSMGARRRMGAVKGAILGLLHDAYQRRDRVALVTFGGDDARVALPATSSVERAAALLAELPTGGATPLAAGLRRAASLVVAERRRDPDRRALTLVVTDGRASGGPAGRAAARDAAEQLACTSDGVVVFDAEEGRVRLGLAGEIAAAAGARLLPMTALSTPLRAEAAA